MANSGPEDVGASRRFDPSPVTPRQVSELREKEGLLLMEAKARVLLANEEASFRALMREGDAQDKLDWLLARFAEIRGYGLKGSD